MGTDLPMLWRLQVAVRRRQKGDEPSVLEFLGRALQREKWQDSLAAGVCIWACIRSAMVLPAIDRNK